MLNYFSVFFIGSCFGSFFLLISQRIPLGDSLIKPSSHCLSCKTRLSPKELIPIYSYLILKGQCRHCQTKIPLLTLNCELIGGSLALICYYYNCWELNYLPYFSLLSGAFLLSLTDYLYLIVEPRIFYLTSSLTLLGYLLTASLNSLKPFDSLLVFLCLKSLSVLYPTGIGGGDIKLLTSWALFLGRETVVISIFLGSCLAICYFISPYSSAKKTSPVPFVPFLSCGLLLQLLWLLNNSRF